MYSGPKGTGSFRLLPYLFYFILFLINILRALNMFTEAHAGKGIWTNRINSRRLLHSIPRRLKYHGPVFCLFWWKLDRPIYSRNKSSPWWFYFLTQAQVFRREEDLICWWGNQPSSVFRGSLLVLLWLWQFVHWSRFFMDPSEGWAVQLKLYQTT